MIKPDLFETHVKDALAHFYDPAHIQTHPLTCLLAEDSDARSKGPGLRKLLLDAIERLKPDDAVPYGRPEWLAYRILRERYLEACSRDEICREFGLSRTSFYRYHNAAISALADILRGQLAQDDMDSPRPLTTTEPIEASGDDHALKEAIRLTRTLPRRQVDLGQIVEGIRETMLPLAAQRGISLFIEFLGPVCVYGDSTVLRQIAISALSEVINSTENSAITVTVQEDNGQAIWRIQKFVTSSTGAAFIMRRGIALSGKLLKEYGGRIWTEQGREGTTLLFSMPISQPKTILIVDDDSDAVRLYRQYLAEYGYDLLQAQTADEFYARLDKVKLDLILLDVLMPGEDGWSIIQHLKAHPEWNCIPIVICSVLSQPQLAVALGAAAVLQKPIQAEELQRTVATLLKY